MERICAKCANSLQEQIDLVRHYSLREFIDYTSEYKLRSKAINEFLKARINKGPEKFDFYIRQHGQLSLEEEINLLQSHRRDLQEIYFRYCRCHARNERFIVQNSSLSKLYYKYGHRPGAEAQKYLLGRKLEDLYRFIKKFEFCDEVMAIFTRQADKKLVVAYNRIHHS